MEYSEKVLKAYNKIDTLFKFASENSLSEKDQQNYDHKIDRAYNKFFKICEAENLNATNVWTDLTVIII